MAVALGLRYITNWGETLCVKTEDGKLFEMKTSDGAFWSCIINTKKSFRYKYCLLKDGIEVRTEEDYSFRTLDDSCLNGDSKLYIDCWQDSLILEAKYTKFANKLYIDCKEEFSHKKSTSYNLLHIKLYLMPLSERYSVRVLGNIELLGYWSEDQSMPLSLSEEGFWELYLPIEESVGTLEYKYVLYDNEEKKVVLWEEGDNRKISLPLLSEYTYTTLTEVGVNMSLPLFRCSGIAIPLFSIYSERYNWGVGDFYSLKEFATWAKQVGQRVIQILPINDTTRTKTWLDSYPYNAISVYALHPMYANPYQIAVLKDKDRVEYYEKKRKELNQNRFVDYEAVNVLKWEYYREIYKQEGSRLFRTKSYKEFYSQNRDWLVPYSVFSCLRDKYNTANFYDWGEYGLYDKHSLVEFEDTQLDMFRDAKLYCFVQYHLYKQLRDVKQYINSLGVVLKGDIPIGISRHSVDAWTNSEQFIMNSQAGAPPDDFSVDGQNWGFPIYNWNNMSLDGYKWWKKRLRNMSECFDAYRIDHILGFFRIWQIPISQVSGVLGSFYPALPYTKKELVDRGIDEDIITELPHITDEVLNNYLNSTDIADFKKQFLTKKRGKNFYVIKPEYDTQRKVMESEKNISELYRKVLYTLIENVLFVKDLFEKDKYHPRISAQKTFAYSLLSEDMKEKYNIVYEDFFYSRNDLLWKEKAIIKLPEIINATDMLPCGEDLGMIPNCVAEVMDRLKILSLEIERMPKAYGEEFANLDRYMYMSVCATSTHDMSTIKGWLNEDKKRSERYIADRLGFEATDFDGKEVEIFERVVENHLKTKSMLCILPLQDWLYMSDVSNKVDYKDEQINVPSNPRHYWKYKMNASVEELKKSKLINDKMKKLTEQYGR